MKNATPCMVQVAVAAATDLPGALAAVDHQFRMACVSGPRVARHDELVIVAPADASLRQLLIQAGSLTPLTAGISLPLNRWDEIARGHREAQRALVLAPPGQVLRLADLTMFDYLLAGADDTARRLGVPSVEGLSPPLRSTLLA